MFKPAALLSFLLLCSPCSWLFADAPPAATAFDTTKYMRVSEVHRGMKGYGLSVFSGTKIDRFDVEVIDVVKNFNPQFDTIMVRCKNDYLQHTGPIEGMSGSPIYLYDDSGKARMVGAFAYGWPFSKDPIGGVQPIQYMLKLPTPREQQTVEKAQSPGNTPTNVAPAAGRWSITDVPLPAWQRIFGVKAEPRPVIPPQRDSFTDLQPLSTPLMTAGASPRLLAELAPLFEGTGLTLMQSGAAVESAQAPAQIPRLEPGSVLAVPMITGDLDMTAIGTCTETIGDRVYGFGHPFSEAPSSGEGAISLPMGSGSIAMVVANLQTSFKVGFISRPTGTLTTDQIVGVAGRVGELPPMVPVTLSIVYEDGSLNKTYHFQTAVHPKLTPMLVTTAVTSALTADHDLPPFHTVNYDLRLKFANGQLVHLQNVSVNSGPQDIVNDLSLPAVAATDNPFKQVELSSVTGSIHVISQGLEAQILSVMVPDARYEPGAQLRAYITYQPFHGEEATLPVSFQLPRNLPDGAYQLTVSDYQHYLEDEKTTRGFRFEANNINEIFDVLKDVATVKHNALYLRLVRQPDGVAVRRTALAHLPQSERQLLLDSGRSDIMPFVSATVQIVPTSLVMNGAANLSVTVKKRGSVQTPTASAQARAASNP